MSISKNVISFFEQIDQNNANYIQHIYVKFLKFLYLNSNNIILENNSVDIFANIQSNCVNLSTLTKFLNSTNVIKLRLDALDNFKIVTKTLKLINTYFKVILSLQKIIVKIYKDDSSNYIKKNKELRINNQYNRICEREEL